MIKFSNVVSNKVQNFILDCFTGIFSIPWSSLKMFLQIGIAASKLSQNRNEIPFIVHRRADKDPDDDLAEQSVILHTLLLLEQ